MKGFITLRGHLMLIILACVALTGCAKPEGAGTESSAQNQAEAKATGHNESARASDNSGKSNRVDACALVTKAEVETALGSSIKSASQGRTTEGTAETAALSECTYHLDGAHSVSLFARRSPLPDNNPGSIRTVRDTMKDMTGKEPLDVKEIGDTAFWTANKQLHVFRGGNIYLYVTMMNFKDDAQAKAKAVELARQAFTNLPR